MCKHIAAVLYGVGARLDEKPELLFLFGAWTTRELIGAHAEAAVHEAVARKGMGRRIAESELAGIFGVELTGETTASRSAKKKAVSQLERKGKKPKR